MNYPNDLKYSKSHEWVKTEDGLTLVGISDFAQDALGDVVFINLPGEGDQVTAGEAFGDVESVKAVSDLVSPVTGVGQSHFAEWAAGRRSDPCSRQRPDTRLRDFCADHVGAG